MGSDHKLREVLEEIYEKISDRGGMPSAEYRARKDDFVFHLTDCRDDLGRLAELLNGAKPASEQDPIALLSILYHVIPHLNAAGRLALGQFSDPFASDWPVADATKRVTTGKADKSKVSA
jgi:hypothetical protein